MMNYLNNEKFEFSNNYRENIKEIIKVEENYNNGFIIHERIIELIFGKINPCLDHFKEKNIKLIRCYIYICDKSKLKSIIIGTLNENLTFNTIYVIEYSSITISEAEREILFKKPIEDYLKLRKCNIIKKEKINIKLFGNDNDIFGNILIFGEKIKVNEQSKINNKRLITPEGQKLNVNQKELEKIINIQNGIKIKDEKILKINNEINNLIKEKELLIKSNEEKEKEIIYLKNHKSEEFNDINKKYEEILDKYNSFKKEQGEKKQNLLNEKNNLENKYQNLVKSLKEKNIEITNLKSKFEEIERNLNEIKLLNEEYKIQLIIREGSLKEYQNKIEEIENKHKKEI